MKHVDGSVGEQLSLIIVVGVLGEGTKGLVVEQDHLDRVKDAARDMTVDEDHVYDFAHNRYLVKPVVPSAKIEQHLFQVNGIINSYRNCQAEKASHTIVWQ